MEWTDYSDYLNSSVWKAKRKLALERANNHCQICNASTDLQVHHRKYSEWGQEPVEDLTVLCESCHNLFTNHSPKSHVVKRRRQEKKNRPQPHKHNDHPHRDSVKARIALFEQKQKQHFSIDRQKVIDRLKKGSSKSGKINGYQQPKNEYQDKLFRRAIGMVESTRQLIKNRERDGLGVDELKQKLHYWTIKLPPAMQVQN